MDGTQHLLLYEQHVNIARKIFMRYSRSIESKEWAEYATHIAILTHDEDLSRLSTHVFHTARAYKEKFVRLERKWQGICPRTKDPVQKKYKGVHECVPVKRKENDLPVYNCTDDEFDVIARETDIDLLIDIKDIVCQIKKDRLMDGKMIVAVEDWLDDVSDAVTAEKLGVSRSYVQRMQRRFRKMLKEKLIPKSKEQ